MLLSKGSRNRQRCSIITTRATIADVMRDRRLTIPTFRPTTVKGGITTGGKNVLGGIVTEGKNVRHSLQTHVLISLHLFHNSFMPIYIPKYMWSDHGCITAVDRQIFNMGVNMGDIWLYGTDYTHMGYIYPCYQEPPKSTLPSIPSG